MILAGGLLVMPDAGEIAELIERQPKPAAAVTACPDCAPHPN